MKKYVRISDILARLQSYAHIDPEVLAAKAELGTRVHDAINKDANGISHNLVSGERDEAYFGSYEIWKHQEDPQYLMMETRLFEDNLMITGQMDALIAHKDGPMLIDYKTSSKPNELIWNMQAHFYWYLLNANGIKVGNTMKWINLRHKKVNVLDEDGLPVHDWTGQPQQKYVALQPKVYEFKFSSTVLQQCIDEANKYWDEKASNFDID